MTARPVQPVSRKKDLRRGLDYIGVTVCFVVHDGHGRILLQKRGPEARDEQGNWDIGGGAVEFGETLAEAVRREIVEELSCEAKEISFLTAFDAHREHEGQQTHWVAFVHAALVDPKKVRIGEPHKVSEIGWFTKDTLPAPLHSQFEKAFTLGVEHGFVS